MTFVARWSHRAAAAACALSVVVLAGCEFAPPEAPSWDVDLTVPLGADTIRVDDVVARTGALGGDDVVAYSVSTQVPPTEIGDALALDSFAIPPVVAHLDTFIVSSPAPFIDFVQLATISPINLEGQSGSIPIPPFSFSTVPPHQVLTGFQSVVIANAALQVSITNNLGLPLDQLQITVTDIGTNGAIFTWSPSGTLDPSETISQTFALPQAGSTVTVGTQFGVDVQGHTPGGVVTLGTNQLRVEGGFTGNIRAVSASAPLPAQTMQRSFVSSFSSDAQLTAARFRSGSLQLTFDNESALPASIALTIPQLIHSGSPVSRQITVPANGSALATIALAGCDYASSGSNVLAVDAVISTDATTGAVTVNSTDALRVTTTAADLVLDTMTGTVDPRTVTLSPVTHTLDMPDGIHEIGLRHAHASLAIESDVAIPARVSLWVTGRARDGRTVTLATNVAGVPPVSFDLAPGAVTTIDFDETNSNLLDLVNLLPETIEVTGSAVVGDGSTIATISRTDGVSGEFNLDVPFTLNLADPVNVEGEVADVTLSADTREQIQERVRSLRLVAEVENTLPLGADVTVVLARTAEGASDSVAVAGQSVVLHGTVNAASGATHSARTSTIDARVEQADLSIFTSGPMYVGTFARLHPTAGEVSAYRTDRLIIRPRVYARAHVSQ